VGCEMAAAHTSCAGSLRNFSERKVAEWNGQRAPESWYHVSVERHEHKNLVQPVCAYQVCQVCAPTAFKQVATKCKSLYVYQYIWLDEETQCQVWTNYRFQFIPIMSCTIILSLVKCGGVRRPHNDHEKIVARDTVTIV